MIRGCIFDLDGTLTRTQESIARPINMTLEHYGLPAQPVEAFNYFAGDGIDNALRRALAAAGDPEGVHFEEGITLCRKWMNEDPLYHVQPYEYVLESLAELKRRGLLLAVFSNKPHESAINVVETIFGKGQFNHIQGQTDRIPIKPDPTGVYEILKKFDLQKEEALYFGDTNTDMMTGKNSGLYTVGVTWGFRPEEELRKYHADRIIHTPKDIVTVVDERNQELAE